MVEDDYGSEQVSYSDQPIHMVIEKQIRELLERADLTDEQKQQILISLSCPCCGSGGVSLSVKLKDEPPR